MPGTSKLNKMLRADRFKPVRFSCIQGQQLELKGPRSRHGPLCQDRRPVAGVGLSAVCRGDQRADPAAAWHGRGVLGAGAGVAGHRMGGRLCQWLPAGAPAGEPRGPYPRLLGDGGAGVGIDPVVASADIRARLDHIARAGRVLLCRGGDDRRKLAQRPDRAEEPGQGLRRLHHDQPGGLDRRADGADAGGTVPATSSS